jgi:hypothetical protein
MNVLVLRLTQQASLHILWTYRSAAFLDGLDYVSA